MTTNTALLFKIENTWHLEPRTGMARQFPTAAAAKRWARLKRFTVKRAMNCDS